ncbi:MAG: PAS domain-containing protein [Pseudomonadales bacterium]|nr:PAS domain-containing protein [Pseudomonadales bacterium]
MTFSLPQIFAAGIFYLTSLIGIAFATEQGWFPRTLTHHPFLRVISLGVFAGAIAFYGSIGMAAQFGSSYLLYFFGASAAFLIAPILFTPLGRIALAHKLGSLADVFVFRYPSPWVGGLISILMLIGALPLIALQIHAISNTVHLLNQEISEDSLAVISCITMTVFAILFGATHATTRDKHEGLIVAMGFGSIFKLLAFVIVAAYAIYGIFGGFSELGNWLNSNHILTTQNSENLASGPSRSMLLMFFTAAIAMPHMFHILFTENEDVSLVAASRWGFPLYMLILSLCIPPILWAANKLGIHSSAEFYAISLGLSSGQMEITILASLAGFAAASGVIIVITLALASMSLHHIFLPFYRRREGQDIFVFLVRVRRLLIGGIILAAYGLYQLFGEQQSLLSLGLVTFIAVLQFLPGLVGAFYWRQANRVGLIAGLLSGFIIWFAMLFFPLMSNILQSTLSNSELIFEPASSVWHIATIASLSVNIIVFIVCSLWAKPNLDEIKAADECMSDSPILPYQGELQVVSVLEMEANLITAIGETASAREVKLVLDELPFSRSERRPFALVRIRNLLESNLSSMLGQTIAHRIITNSLPFRENSTGQAVVESVQNMENRFEDKQQLLTGLAAELDNLRRYHRQMLQNLPTPVCSVDKTFKVLTWNRAMQELTGIPAAIIVDHKLANLPTDWYGLLFDFINTETINRLKMEFDVRSQPRLLYLHKSLIDTNEDDVVLVIEDITDEQKLENQLVHNQRLASIGQLAAGVAHEIGNPITGIACLAQNIKIETDHPELLEISSEILEQTERVSGILESLVNFAHGGKTDNKRPSVPIDICQCINEAINLLSLATDSIHINYVNNCPTGIFVLGDGQRLLQVFVNILANARDASNTNDEVVIIGAIVDRLVRIDIVDLGHGIALKDMQQIFEPFYTTKDPGQGTGLGLAIVNSIIGEHHGSISAKTSDPRGTRIRIKLPSYQHDENHLTSGPDSLFSA